MVYILIFCNFLPNVFVILIYFYLYFINFHCNRLFSDGYITILLIFVHSYVNRCLGSCEFLATKDNSANNLLPWPLCTCGGVFLRYGPWS